jgi:hypothetical protein
VECDVCGREMRKWPLPPSQWQDEVWSCSWCYAMTSVGGEAFEIARPPYMPVDMRWERAVADELPADVAHAFGSVDRTLCGLERSGISPSDHLWFPERGEACDACRQAAEVVDERWPRNMRGTDARVSVSRRVRCVGSQLCCQVTAL